MSIAIYMRITFTCRRSDVDDDATFPALVLPHVLERQQRPANHAQLIMQAFCYYLRVISDCQVSIHKFYGTNIPLAVICL